MNNVVLPDKCCACEKKDPFRFLSEERGYLICKWCGLVTTVPRDKEDYDDQLITHYAEVDPALRVAESRRGMYRRFLNEIEYRRKQGSRLLDIGCGKGYFPVQAKARGWEAEGVDIVPDLIDQGREEFGVQLHCGDFTEIDISHN